MRVKKGVGCKMTQVAWMKILSARTLVPCQSDTGEFFAEDTEVNAVNLNPHTLTHS